MTRRPLSARLLQIIGSWVISPLMGGLLAFLSFFAIRRFILVRADPVTATKRAAPWIVGFVVGVMVLSFIYKVLSNRMDAPPLVLALTAAAGAGLVAGVMTTALMLRHLGLQNHVAAHLVDLDISPVPHQRRRQSPAEAVTMQSKVE